MKNDAFSPLIATGFDSHNNEHPAAFLPPPPSLTGSRGSDFSLAEHLDGKRWLSHQRNEAKNTMWVRIAETRLQQITLGYYSKCLKINTRRGFQCIDVFPFLLICLYPCDLRQHAGVMSLSLNNDQTWSKGMQWILNLLHLPAWLFLADVCPPEFGSGHTHLGTHAYTNTHHHHPAFDLLSPAVWGQRHVWEVSSNLCRVQTPCRDSPNGQMVMFCPLGSQSVLLKGLQGP